MRVDSVNVQRPARSLQDSQTLNTNLTQDTLSPYAQYSSTQGSGLSIGGIASTAAITNGGEGAEIHGFTGNGRASMVNLR